MIRTLRFLSMFSLAFLYINVVRDNMLNNTQAVIILSGLIIALSFPMYLDSLFNLYIKKRMWFWSALSISFIVIVAMAVIVFTNI
jgi:hypothetical protein